MPFYFDQDGSLKAPELDRWPWLVHSFTTRLTGDLRRPEDQRRFAAALGMELVTLHQIHSAIVRVAADGATVPGMPGDALIVVKPGLLAGVKTADCLPVLLVDARQRAVAGVHAGWRGTAKRVVEKAAGKMRASFGSQPEDLHAAIGPGIRTCCFEVGPEVLEEFACQFADASEFCRRDPPNPALTRIPLQTITGGPAQMRQLVSDRGRVDLAEAVRRQLLTAGVPAEQIYDSKLCTACDLVRFYSYRREKEAAGRMLAVIGVRPGK